MTSPLRLGRIGFLNVLPIYYALEQGLVSGEFEVTSGPPAALNKLMRKGALDVSAASSIEYARSAEQYYLIPNLAIGSCGPVQSVLLLSQTPIEQLDGRTVLVSAETHTSAVLLKLLMHAKFDLEPKFESGNALEILNQGRRPAAILAIGDAALHLRRHPEYPVALDLGEAWRQWTGLPFIFGVWIAQRKAMAAAGARVVEAANALVRSKEWGATNFETILDVAAQAGIMNREELVSYFDGLVFDFGQQEQAGIQRFYELLVKHGQLDEAPELVFLPE